MYAVQLLAREDVLLDEDLAEPLPAAAAALRVHRHVQLELRDHAMLHEQVAQAVAPVHDRRVRDAAAIEVDVAEVVPVGDGETPRLLPHGEELEDVGERRFLETALDRH